MSDLYPFFYNRGLLNFEDYNEIKNITS